jgi:hypothetical protein
MSSTRLIISSITSSKKREFSFVVVVVNIFGKNRLVMK